MKVLTFRDVSKFCSVNTANVGIFFHLFPMAEHLLCRLSLFVAGRTAQLSKSYSKKSKLFSLLACIHQHKTSLDKTNAEPLERVSVDSKILFA